MKDFCIKIRPKNKKDLEAALHGFWATVDVVKCNKYIDHLRTVVPIVIENNGDVSGH